MLDTYYIVYLDDILIYSNSREEHADYVRLVLDQLRRYALYASCKKCNFFVTEVKFLGFIVGTLGVSIDLRRVAVIKD